MSGRWCVMPAAEVIRRKLPGFSAERSNDKPVLRRELDSLLELKRPNIPGLGASDTSFSGSSSFTFESTREAMGPSSSGNRAHNARQAFSDRQNRWQCECASAVQSYLGVSLRAAKWSMLSPRKPPCSRVKNSEASCLLLRKLWNTELPPHFLVKVMDIFGPPGCVRPSTSSLFFSLRGFGLGLENTSTTPKSMKYMSFASLPFSHSLSPMSTINALSLQHNSLSGKKDMSRRAGTANTR
mmetsp:Transcript_12638/g.31539  ORF Transcript_12638/g.31539 Transcript_12638/m.31539 type:complete len:240 (-) Transcript_12638:921-1640(-)